MPDPRGNESDVGTADVARPMRGPTRRQALALAGGTAAAIGMAVGPFSGFFSAGAAEGDGPAEIELASWLVGIELAARDLYESVRTSADFDEATQALVSTCAGHHEDQGGALAAMVAATGATAPADANEAFFSEYQGRVNGAGDGAAKAAVFAEIEDGFAATYFASFATIVSAPLAAVAAQILATDAAHGVAWAAAAAGQGIDKPMPPEDAIGEGQTADGQFDRDHFTTAPEADTEAAADTDAEPTTTTGDES